MFVLMMINVPENSGEDESAGAKLFRDVGRKKLRRALLA
jgi:hypothetical protein